MRVGTLADATCGTFEAAIGGGGTLGLGTRLIWLFSGGD